MRFIYKPNAFCDDLEGLHLGRQLFFYPGRLPIQAPPRKSCVRAAGKKTGPEKQTAYVRKKQMAPLHGSYVLLARKKNKCLKKEKGRHEANAHLQSHRFRQVL